MVRNNTHKLIYYPVGNCFQLFDLENDPYELNNVFEDLEHRYVRDSLVSLLRNSVYGSDHLWLKVTILSVTKRKLSVEGK